MDHVLSETPLTQEKLNFQFNYSVWFERIIGSLLFQQLASFCYRIFVIPSDHLA